MNFPRAALLLMLSWTAVAFPQTFPSTAPSKRWATDFSAYLRSHPGNWMLATSVRPALTPEEALADARRQAARSLAIQMLPRFSNQPCVAWLQRRLEASLLAGQWIQDQSITANQRPYGTIWSASLLINASPKNYSSLVAEFERELAAQRSRFARIVGYSIILALAVACLFLIANSLTRGFLRFRLAIASLAIVATGIFGIMHLI